MRKIVSFAIILALALVCINIKNVAAQTDVWTDKLTYMVGETVYINWVVTAPSFPPCKIEIYYGTYPGGTFVTQWTGLGASGTLTWDTTGQALGRYSIVLNDKVVVVAVSTVFVIPELPIGAVMATIAAFGALGSIKLKQRKT